MYVALMLTKVPALAAGTGRADWSGSTLTFGMLCGIATSVALAATGMQLPLIALIGVILCVGTVASMLFGKWRAGIARRSHFDQQTQKRMIREAETQRQLAEARRTGALRRWKLRSI